MLVAQCWDDGNVDDVRLIDILRRHGAKASFNLNAGGHRAERFLSWRYNDRKEVWKLAQGELVETYRGFTVANHSVNHPHLPQLSAAESEREIREGKDRLEQLFGYAVTGFAYPFGAYDQRTMDQLRASGHVYARTVQAAEPCLPPADPMAFHPSCFHLEGDFWSRFERAKASDGLFYFWGHSYEMETEADWQAFEAKIARLSADPAVRWVDLPALFAR